MAARYRRVKKEGVILRLFISFLSIVELGVRGTARIIVLGVGGSTPVAKTRRKPQSAQCTPPAITAALRKISDGMRIDVHAPRRKNTAEGFVDSAQALQNAANRLMHVSPQGGHLVAHRIS